jgi:hypothetical protein
LSNASAGRPTEFDDWLAAMVQRHREFTVLVILTAIRESKVIPLRSTFLHVIGGEVGWGEIRTMFESAERDWNGAAFFATKAQGGGPIDNATARLRLVELQDKVRADRMVLNEGDFFDALGRRIELEPLADPC